MFCAPDYLDHGVAIVGYGISTHQRLFGILPLSVEIFSETFCKASTYHIISFAMAPLIRSTGTPQYTTSTEQSNKMKFTNMIKTTVRDTGL